MTGSVRTARSSLAWRGSPSSTSTLPACRRRPGVYRLSWLTLLVDQDRQALSRDPSARARARPAARRARHDAARGVRHRSDRRGDVDRRGRRSVPVRQRVEVRPLVRHRSSRAVDRGGRRHPGATPARLRRQPTHQQPSSTSPASPSNGSIPTPAPTSNARWLRARHDAELAGPTSDTSPTASSDACGKTKPDASATAPPPPLDKGASDAAADRAVRIARIRDGLDEGIYPSARSQNAAHHGVLPESRLRSNRDPSAAFVEMLRLTSVQPEFIDTRDAASLIGLNEKPSPDTEVPSSWPHQHS